MNPVATLLLFPFQPRRVALAHAHTPLWKVYLIHWLGLLILAGVLIGLDLVLRRYQPRHTLDLHLVLHDNKAAITALVVILCGEGVFVLFAKLMTCWAGADEPIRDTWRYALRVSWLFVAHLPWVVGGCSATFLIGIYYEMREDGALLTIIILTSIIIWSIVGYLRAMTAPRHTETVQADPMCEWCGYTVAYLDPSGRCPECGRPIPDSLDSAARRPFVADDLLDVASEAWINPEPLFRHISVTTRPTHAVIVLVQALVIAGVTAGFSFVVTVLLAVEPPPTMALAVMLAFGAFGGWVYLVFASAVASGLGEIASRRTGRNRFVAGFIVVALTSGSLPIWACVASATWAGMMFKLPWRREAVLLSFITINAIVAVFYCRALGRRMRFLQHANR